MLCAEPAVRRHLAFVSLSPRTSSREPCPPLPPPVCLPVLVRLSVGQREASTGAMCICTVALFCGPGRGAVRLHAKPAHTRQELCCCFPLSCYSHPSACSSRAGAPSTTVARCWYLAAEIPCSQRLPSSTRRPGGLNDARCLLLHHSRRGAGHVTPHSPYIAGHAEVRHRRGEGIHNPWCLARSFPCATRLGWCWLLLGGHALTRARHAAQ